jgi:hypothetical protein
MRLSIWFLTITALAAGVALRAQTRPDLATILRNQTVWGKDFGSVLANLQGWTEINEQKIAIFPSRVEGTKPLASTEARNLAQQFTKAFSEQKPEPDPRFRDMLRNFLLVRPAITANAVKTPDGESNHVAWTHPRPTQLLAPGLMVATIKEQFGEPERSTRELIQTQDERRPIVLKKYHYANDAAIFAEADFSPRPGSIDRAILNVTKVKDTVFQQVRR